MTTIEGTLGGDRRVQIRRFGVIQTANLVALLYLIVFAIFAVPAALITAAVGSAFGGAAPLSGFVWLLIPIFYAIIGWIFTAIACLIYNLCAGWIGGVEITLREPGP